MLFVVDLSRDVSSWQDGLQGDVDTVPPENADDIRRDSTDRYINLEGLNLEPAAQDIRKEVGGLRLEVL